MGDDTSTGMSIVRDGTRISELRTRLLQYLNESGLNGRAIMAIARDVSALKLEPGHTLLKQHERDFFIYFMMEGKIDVFLEDGDGQTKIGQRGAVTMLGEIAYFNNTPATATVKISDDGPAVMLMLTHKQFGKILDHFPDIKQSLARIGDQRVLAQYNGFIHYPRFREMIGRLKDRFAISRAFASDLDNALKIHLYPLLNKTDRIMDVGDGPGVVSELICADWPELEAHLYLQSSDLEGAVYNPLVPRASDLSKATPRDEKFQCIIALQVFNNMPISELEPQLKLAQSMLKKNGLLVLIKAALLDVRHPSDAGDALLIFEELEGLVDKVWPGIMAGHTLVETTFDDADLEPIMLWNQDFSALIQAGSITVPDTVSSEEKVLLDELFKQNRQGYFDPDAIHFEWLALKVRETGFKLEKVDENPENKFYFHVYRNLK